MRARWSWLGLVALCPWIAACSATPVQPSPPIAVAPTAARLADGAALYGLHCASCHGAKGEGQPDWAVTLPDGSLPAPPHDATGHTWHHSDVELLRIIAEGGKFYLPTSKMPAFGSILSDAEQRAVLAHIKSMWGEREVAYQRQQTLQHNAELAAATTVPTTSP